MPGGSVLGRRPLFSWAIDARLALRFLGDVRPWLQVKGEQADIAIAFQRARRRPGPGRWLVPAEKLAYIQEADTARLRLLEARTA